MRRYGRRGFFLLWAELAVCLVMLLAGSVMAVIANAAYDWRMSRETADAVLIAEEMLETMKYNRRFGGKLAVPAEAERNSRIYRIEASTETETREGLRMDAAVCTVTTPSGETVSFRTFIGAHETLP